MSVTVTLGHGPGAGRRHRQAAPIGRAPPELHAGRRRGEDRRESLARGRARAPRRGRAGEAALAACGRLVLVDERHQSGRRSGASSAERVPTARRAEPSPEIAAQRWRARRPATPESSRTTGPAARAAASSARRPRRRGPRRARCSRGRRAPAGAARGRRRSAARRRAVRPRRRRRPSSGGRGNGPTRSRRGRRARHRRSGAARPRGAERRQRLGGDPAREVEPARREQGRGLGERQAAP